MRHISLDILGARLPPTRVPSAAPVIRPAIQLGLIRADLEDEDAPVVQTCVPTVITDGADSYRLGQATAGKGVKPLT